MEDEEHIMDLVPVISTGLTAVGYDGDKSELTVKFKNNREYVYYDVPASVYDGLLAAESKGRFFVENIKNHYEY